jgi:hypothetical protein
MAINISPGVYSKIIDLSTYVQQVPSSIGFACGLSEKGRDNELIFLGSREELISEFGEPDITKYGKFYGQGPYCAYNHLGESGALYWIRCLPDDAAYSNIRLDTVTTYADTTSTSECTWVQYFDNTNYTAGANTSWSSNRWETSDTSAGIRLTVTGSFVNDFRPTHIRITGNITDVGNLGVVGFDGSTYACLPEQPNSKNNSTGFGERDYIFEWSNESDLASLIFQGYDYITNIEYLSCPGVDTTDAGTLIQLTTDSTNFTAGVDTAWDSTSLSYYSTNLTNPVINLNVAGSWADGFRVDAIVFIDVMAYPAVCYVYDTSDNLIGTGLIGTSAMAGADACLVELDFWRGNDIGSVQFVKCSSTPCDSTSVILPEPEPDPETGATTTVTLTYVDSLNTEEEITTNLESTSSVEPLGFLVPIGRGKWYNNLGVRISEYQDPTVWQTYVLDVYEKQSDGDEVIIESFVVSFDPNARDNAGESLWIVNVLELYSNLLRCYMTLSDDEYTDGCKLIARVYDKDIGTVSVDLSTALLSDTKQDFSEWEGATNADYVVAVKDAKGTEIWGWLGAASGVDSESIAVYTTSDLATQGWNGDTSDFNTATSIEYQVRKAYTSVADAFTSSEPVPMRKGSDGSLFDSAGELDTTVATTLLNQAYSGIIDDDVLDSENIYFSIVYDCGYPADVKTSISTLCQTRRDCVGILDNGDNASVTASLAKRNNVNTFNNYFVALYEEYNQIFDSFTGKDIWVSPVYHMSYLLPRNDNVAELWFAAAGFNRASIDTIKELRFNPKLGERDQMYLKQLNPIVQFNPGYTVWGQLTSQAKASALQDLNIVRLLLYIKRALEEYCRYFIYEQNDEITWSLVANDIIPFLEDIRKKRGLYNFTVEVGATDYERKTKKFHVNVTLEPTRVVEQIELNFFIV